MFRRVMEALIGKRSLGAPITDKPAQRKFGEEAELNRQLPEKGLEQLAEISARLEALEARVEAADAADMSLTSDGCAEFFRVQEQLETEVGELCSAFSESNRTWSSSRESFGLAVRVEDCGYSLDLRRARATALMAGVELGQAAAAEQSAERDRSRGSSLARERWSKLDTVRDLAIRRRQEMPELSRAEAIRRMQSEIIAAAREAQQPLTGSSESVFTTIEGWLRRAGVR